MDFLGLNPEQWVNVGISALIIAVTAVFGRWIIGLILDRVVGRITGHTSTTLDDAIFEALRGPFYLLAVFVAVNVALQRIDFLTDVLEFDLSDFYYVIYALIVVLMAWRLVGSLTDWYAEDVASKTETQMDEQLVPLARRVLYILVVIIAAIIILGHFNVEVGGLVATLGIGSLAIALAAQEALTDTISGFIIMIDRPFSVGDRIEIQELGTWGDVVDIGLRSSRIRTRDNRMVIVPNSIIGKSLIVNYARPDPLYRIEIEIGVAYGSDLEEVRQILIEAVRGVEGVKQDKPVEALFLHFGDSALIFRVRWWLDSYVDTRRMFDSVNTAMYNALNAAGVELPFPQRDVHHKFDAGDGLQVTRVPAGEK